jgi:ubiquinone/menaquinone biosynthesis C-methylase UbiE
MFGAEHSIKEWFRRNQFRYTTADLFDQTVDIKVDIQKTPFSDESWSLIICNHVLQHVHNFTLALYELYRILKKDGLLILTVATDNNLETTYEDSNIVEQKHRMEEYGQADYLRIFGRDFKIILEKIGFLAEIIDENIPSNIRAVTGPANHDDKKVYLCRKR